MSTSIAEQADLMPPGAAEPELQPPTTPNSIKKKRKPRATLTPQHMSTLIASYRMHYASYSQSRESVTQLVPSSVWKKVYNDFIHFYPEAASFDNEHLKARVRNALKEKELTGNIAELVQQNEQILKRLKMAGASPLIQQVLWRNHTAEIMSQQRPLMSAVPVQLPSNDDQPLSSSEQPPEPPAPSVSPSQTAVPDSNDHRNEDLQVVQPVQSSSEIPSELHPILSETRSPDAVNLDSPPANGTSTTNPGPIPVSKEPLASKPTTSHTIRSLPSTPAMGKKALMQTQTTALCKMSMDFNKACAGIVEFLEIHKAKAKQEENKVMLANYEKAREMGVITLEEMKSKARKLLDL